MKYSLRTTSHISRVRSLTTKKRKKKQQAKLYKGVQASGTKVGAEGEEGERTLAGVLCSPEQSTEKDSSASSSLGISKLRSKPG